MASSRPQIIILARLAFLVLVCACASCELVKYSPHEDDLPSSASRINQKSIDRLQETPPGDAVRVAFVTDTQNSYDETLAFVRAINERGDVDFVVHGGDITDVGIIQEYEWIHEIFERLDVPYMAVIGNHDLLANGGDLYQAVYGKKNFAFIYGRTKYVFVDTNSRQYDFPGDVPDLRWLENQLAAGPDFDRAIVIGHVPPSHGGFDSELEQPFAQLLEQNTPVPLALFGHVHDFSVKKPFGEVTYLVTASAAKREYTLVTLTQNDVTYERVEF